MAKWEPGAEAEMEEAGAGIVREVREAQGGGMGEDLGTREKLTSTCQHLYTSAVQPCRHEDHVQLEIPIR